MDNKKIKQEIVAKLKALLLDDEKDIKDIAAFDEMLLSFWWENTSMEVLLSSKDLKMAEAKYNNLADKFALDLTEEQRMLFSEVQVSFIETRIQAEDTIFLNALKLGMRLGMAIFCT